MYVSQSAPIQLFYTIAQLWKLHKKFAQPSATKPYDLLKTAGAKTVTPKTFEKLEYLVSTCEPCQKIRTALKRYGVTYKAETDRFNAKLYIDFMYIEGASLLHMVDDATHFSAVQFVQPLTNWIFLGDHTYVMGNWLHWIASILGFDDVLQFRDTFEEICRIHDDEWQPVWNTTPQCT